MGISPGSGFAALPSGISSGLDWTQDYKTKQLENQKRSLLNQGAQRVNAANQSAYDAYSAAHPQGGYAPIHQGGTGSPVNIIDPVQRGLHAVARGARSMTQSLTGHAAGPVSQNTVPGKGNAAASPPGPSSSDAAAGGTPGASGAQTSDNYLRAGLDPFSQPEGYGGTPPQQPPSGYADGGPLGLHPPHGVVAPSGVPPRRPKQMRPRNTEASPSQQGSTALMADGGPPPTRVQPGDDNPRDTPEQLAVANKLPQRPDVTPSGAPTGLEAAPPANRSQASGAASNAGKLTNLQSRTPPAPSNYGADYTMLPGSPRSPGPVRGTITRPGDQPPPAAATGADAQTATGANPAPTGVPARGQGTTTPTVAAGKAGAPAGGNSADYSGDQYIDFSKVHVDHAQIPNTSAEDWNSLKSHGAMQLIAQGVPAAQAQVEMDNQISNYQHQQFMQYMSQGIALDRAGNKAGAMAALRTAYQYMPTGHDMHFGTAPDGTIVGFGVDEKTGQSIGKPVLLNQRTLTGLLNTYKDANAFKSEAADYQAMNLRAANFQNTSALAHATVQQKEASAEYLRGRNQTQENVAGIRAGGQMGAAQIRANAYRSLSPQSQALVNQAFKSIMDPNQQSQALILIAEMEQRYGPQARQEIVGRVMDYLQHPQDIERARANGIPVDSIPQEQGNSVDDFYRRSMAMDTSEDYSGDARYGENGIPPRP